MHVKSTILISNCKLWISLYFEKRYMTVFFMMMMMVIIMKTLLRMLHLHPAHWHSLKTQLQQPLVPEAFPIWFLAVGFCPFLSSLSFFLLFQHIASGSSASQTSESWHVLPYKELTSFMLCVHFCYSKLTLRENFAYFSLLPEVFICFIFLQYRN